MLQGKAIIINPNKQHYAAYLGQGLALLMSAAGSDHSLYQNWNCVWGSSVRTAASWVVKPHPLFKVMIS